MKHAKLNSVLISISGNYKYLHWLVYYGDNCWLLPSNTNWEVSAAINGGIATPVLYSVILLRCNVKRVKARGWAFDISHSGSHFGIIPVGIAIDIHTVDITPVIPPVYPILLFLTISWSL